MYLFVSECRTGALASVHLKQENNTQDVSDNKLTFYIGVSLYVCRGSGSGGHGEAVKAFFNLFRDT